MICLVLTYTTNVRKQSFFLIHKFKLLLKISPAFLPVKESFLKTEITTDIKVKYSCQYEKKKNQPIFIMENTFFTEATFEMMMRYHFL